MNFKEFLSDYVVVEHPRPHWWSGNSVYHFSTALDEGLTYFNLNGNVIQEAAAAAAVRRQFDQGRFGGRIIFSTDINATLRSDKGFLINLKNRIAAKLQSLSNSWQVKSKLSKLISHLKQNSPDFANVSFSIGPYYKGRYHSPDGKVYDETSLAIEVIGIATDMLIDLATAIAREFQQEEVLVFDNSTGRIFTVDRK